MLRPIIIITAFCLLICEAYSQNNVLKKVDEIASRKLAEKGAILRMALDSVDFQYAISINRGAGFFDIEQKGETGSKLLYSFKKYEDMETWEKLRDTLEIGIGMYNIRRYEMAESTLRKTIRMMEQIPSYQYQTFPHIHVVKLRAVSNLGLILLTQGKLAEAESIISWTIDESEQLMGTLSAAYIANLNNKARLLQLNGKYTEAEKLFDEAINLAKQLFGGGKQLAIILNNKAMLFQVLGQYENAITVMNLAIEASDTAPRKVFEGEKSFDNRKFQANLATILQASGKYDLAESKFLELKTIYENRRQTKNAEYAGLMNQLALLYIAMGRPQDAREPLVKSLNVYKKRWGENNIYFARAANDLGNLHRQLAQYEEAETWLSKSFELRQKLLAPTHPEYIETQESLAILYWKTGKNKKAYGIYKDVMAKTIDVINEFFPPMSEAEKTQFWDITAPRFQRFYNFALESIDTNTGIMVDVYNFNMATKGLLLSATSKVRNNILQSGKQELIASYLKWQDTKEQLARLYSYSKGKLKAQKIDLAALEEEANNMEKALSEQSAAFSTAFSVYENDLKSIANILHEDEAIVDIIRIKKYHQDFTDEIRYLALVLKKGTITPAYCVIKDGNKLESHYARYYRNAIQFKIDDQTSFNQFWAEISGLIAGKSKVYVSPDGVYNQININTLKLPDNQYVINRHDLVLIGNSKDLSAIKNEKKEYPNKDAFLLGFPDYGTPTVSVLPGTRIEINDISGILKTNGYTTLQFMEHEANETSVKQISSPQIVHIATHGYFKKDVDVGGSVFGIHTDNAANNPLLRSGLILAGAGKSLADTLEADITLHDNGLLTAYEAMNLNLDKTQLVVLSACETGLGEVKSGEGVYGLQRAFQVAGADALIMSLWKVSDEATQQLMTNFYQNWIQSGDKHAAFRQAQLSLMEQYAEPYYWGAFVMIGG